MVITGRLIAADNAWTAISATQPDAAGTSSGTAARTPKAADPEGKNLFFQEGGI